MLVWVFISYRGYDVGKCVSENGDTGRVIARLMRVPAK